MWYNRTGQKLHKDTWKNLFKYHKETKLIEIQWKILHNIFPTNILLNRIGIKDTEKCEFCNEKDFVEHMFVNCKRIDRLWENISHKISSKLNMRILLTEQIILLGVEQADYLELTDIDIKFINTIMIIGKCAIIKSKFNNMNVELVFEKEMNLRKLHL